MSFDRVTFTTLVKGLLALCLLCNALGWSLHVQAATLGDADHPVVQADSGNADSDLNDVGSVVDDGIDHCGHGELHFFGIIPSLDKTVTPAGNVLTPSSGPHYTGPHLQPLVIPPIA